jgi:hypothetical protein
MFGTTSDRRKGRVLARPPSGMEAAHEGGLRRTPLRTEIRGARRQSGQLAERLVADRGYEVEVLTTCSLMPSRGVTSFPRSRSDINRVRVLCIGHEAGRDESSSPPLRAQLMKDPSRADDGRGPLARTWGSGGTECGPSGAGHFEPLSYAALATQPASTPGLLTGGHLAMESRSVAAVADGMGPSSTMTTMSC